MSRVVLSRAGYRRYTVGGTVDVAYIFRDHRWEITACPEHANATLGSEWLSRNGILGMQFDSLRDARGYLEALFELDPPAQQPISRILSRMRQQEDGLFRVQTEVGEYQVQREAGWWHICTPKGEKAETLSKVLAAEWIADDVRIHAAR